MEIRKLGKRNKIVGVIDKFIHSFEDINENVISLLNISSKERVLKSLKIVGLEEDVLDKNFTQLSSGERQKVINARVLLENEDVMVFYNPTMFLDFNSKKSLIKLLKMMKMRYNKTIIIISSDIEFLYSVVDYVYLIEEETVILEGDKYSVFSSNEFKDYGLDRPLLMQFSDLVKEKKGINMGYRDDVNDLMKDVYRFTRKEFLQ